MPIIVDNTRAAAILLGHAEEHLATTIEFDLSAWLEKWPAGVADIIYTRPDGVNVFGVTSMTDNILSWPITNEITAVPGDGSVEIRLSEGDVRKISDTIPTRVYPSKGIPDGETPPPAPTYIEVILSAHEDVMDARGEVLEAREQVLSARDEARGLAEEINANEPARREAESQRQAAEALRQALAAKWGTIYAEAETLEPNEDATATITQTATSTTFSFGIPKGEKGDLGDDNLIPATTESLGGIKVGEGLKITEDGTLSVDKSQIHEVPAGGAENQVLKKMSGDDYDYGWGDTVKVEVYGSSITII